MFEFLTVFETFAYGFPWPLGGSGGPNLSEVGGCGSFFLFGCVTSHVFVVVVYFMSLILFLFLFYLCLLELSVMLTVLYFLQSFRRKRDDRGL